MLFLPWRNETKDILNKNIEALFNENIDIIVMNNYKLNQVDFNQRDIDEAIKKIKGEQEENDESKIHLEETDIFQEINQDYTVNIFQDIGKERKNQVNFDKISFPALMLDEEYSSLLRNLNNQQRKYFMNLIENYKTKKFPIYHLIIGAAGTVKTHLIKAIYQYFFRLFNRKVQSKGDTIKVILCAPTGKAAYNIGGMTTFSAFSLPVSQAGDKYSSFSPAEHALISLRNKYQDVQLIIIDEISMVGKRQFTNIDKRCREIFGNREPFGGVSVILVGDFNQLRPVLDKWIFEIDTNNLGENLQAGVWRLFKLFELHELMRQKGKEFAIALTNMANANMTSEDINLLRSREIKNQKNRVPAEAVHLFYSNSSVSTYNKKKLDSMTSYESYCPAIDKVEGRGTILENENFLRESEKIEQDPSSQLEKNLRLRIDAKYMMTVNLNVSDGLMNGSCGVLKRIQINEKKLIFRLWIQFDDPNMGAKTRSQYEHMMNLLKIPNTWTPVERWASLIKQTKEREKGVLQIYRNQFPLVVAEAMTIHKSQGLTLTYVVLFLLTFCGNRIEKRALYVGCSRVTSLKGLFLDGDFEPPSRNLTASESLVVKEMQRLKEESILQIDFIQDIKSLNADALKIVFQNIQSFKKHKPDIVNDEFYKSSDILIFVEA
jgi:ATP-dependent exoDNAse (exonuclease V) alpha subunit